MLRSSVLAVLACSLVALPASGSNFWERAEAPPAADPDQGSATPETFDELVEKGDRYADTSEQYRAMWFQALQHRQLSERNAFMTKARQAAKQAIRFYDMALELHPDDGNLHFRCGHLTYTYLYEYYETNGPVSLRDKAGAHAVAHWDAFERISPDDPRRTGFVREGHVSSDRRGWADWAQDIFEPQTYQFARSIYYTKRGGTQAYEKAIEDYDYLLEAAPRNDATARWIAQLLTNSAEIHMAIGNVEEAIDRYRQGLEYSNEALYMFGLAVALDRAGEKQSALEQMRDAIDSDPKLEALGRSGVFFIPKGDVQYYFGLANEAQGKSTEALLHFRAYVDQVKDARFEEHAREHIDRLAEAKKQRK